MQHPFRANSKTTISQKFTDGICDICTVNDVALPGNKPIKALHRMWHLAFDELRVGYTRYYDALQNQIRIEKVIRVQNREISNQNIAVIGGEQYAINQVQTVKDVMPPCLDLTLVRIEQKYKYQEECQCGTIP